MAVEAAAVESAGASGTASVRRKTKAAPAAANHAAAAGSSAAGLHVSACTERLPAV